MNINKPGTKRLATLGKVVSALVVVGLCSVAGTGAASADSIYWGGGTRLAASVDATCNNGNHLMTAQVVIAPEPGYEAGQYVHYKIAIKDVTFGAGSWQFFPWQGPFVVKRTTFVNNGITYVYEGQSVGSYTITGVAGRRYQVAAVIEWWNPSRQMWEANSVAVETSVSQYVASGSGFYFINPSLCWT